MLRAMVQLVAAVLMLAGLWLLTVGSRPAGIQALMVGAIILVAVRYERWRDRARPDAQDTAWRATGERFEDPGTGQMIEVEYNSQTGERRYKNDAS
jgi:hypothetical protein